MQWDSSPLSHANVNQGSDSPASARADIDTAFTAIDQIRAGRGVAGGFAALDEQGLIPFSHYNAQTILGVLLFVDGAGSLLDADMLDGVQGAGYLLTNGTRDMVVDQVGGWNLKRQTSTNNARATALSLQGLNTPTAATAAGYGVALDVKLNNAAGTLTNAGFFAVDWVDATNASEDAALVFGHAVAGTVTEALRVVNRKLQIAAQSSPGGSPPADTFWLYMTSGGLTIKDSGGTEALVTAGGATDHNTLLNLTSGDVHTQYFRTDGSRVLTGDLQLGTNAILTTDLGGDPDPPSAGQVYLYTKGGELYVRSSAGVVGPFSTGGVTSHADLDDLDENNDDHPIYLLRQPSANVVMNDAGDDIDVRWEGADEQWLWQIDAGSNVVGVGKSDGALAALTTGRFQVYGTSTAAGIYASTAGGTAITGTATTGSAIAGVVTAATSDVQAGSFLRTGASALHSASPVVLISDESTTNGGLALFLWQKTTTARLLDARLGNSGTKVLNAYGIGSGLVINEDGADYDVRIEGDTRTHLVFVDTSADVVNINGTLTGARFNVTGGTMTGIAATTSGSETSAILGTAAAGNTIGLRGVNTSSGYGVLGESLTGVAVAAFRDTDGASTFQPVLSVGIADAADLGPAIQVISAGSGPLLEMRSGLQPKHVFPVGGGFYLHEHDADMSGYGVSGMWGIFAKADGLYQVTFDGVVSKLGSGGGIVTSAAGVVRTPSVLEETITTNTGVSFLDTSFEVPAGSIIERVIAVTTSAVGGGYDVGVDGSTQRYGAGVNGSVPSSNLTFVQTPGPVFVAQDRKIRVSHAGGTNFTSNTGQVRVTVIYYAYTLP